MTVKHTGRPDRARKRRPLEPACPQGFSFIEMTVVIALLAILAAATLLKPVNWFRSAQIQNGKDQIVMIDRLARQQTVRTNETIHLTFDLTHATVTRHHPQDPDQRSHRMKLPGRLALKRFLTASQPPVSHGKATIAYGHLGHCPTYAMLLHAPDQTAQWIVIAGLTGQVVTATSEKEIHELLQQLVP